MKKLFSLIAVAIIGISTTFANPQTTQKSESTSKTAVHTKKDGTLDKRYKENKTTKKVVGPTKKDGTPDMRYKANKTTTTKTTKKTQPK